MTLRTTNTRYPTATGSRRYKWHSWFRHAQTYLQEQPIPLKRHMVGCLLVVFLAFGPRNLNAVVVKGIVIDQDKRPIPGAQIRALDGNVSLGRVPEITSLEGQYSISLTSLRGDHLTLEVQTPGSSRTSRNDLIGIKHCYDSSNPAVVYFRAHQGNSPKDGGR